MKVVVNSGHGGLYLSDEAIEMCIQKGMSVHRNDRPQADAHFVELDDELRSMAKRRFAYNHTSGESEKLLRCHPVVVEVVEQLQERASGPFASLRVVEVPYVSTNEWEMDESGGQETVRPKADAAGSFKRIEMLVKGVQEGLEELKDMVLDINRRLQDDGK